MLSPVVECKELELLLETRLPSHLLADLIIVIVTTALVYIISKNILLSIAVAIYALNVYNEYKADVVIVPLLQSVERCAIARLCVQRNFNARQNGIKNFWGVFWGSVWHGDPTYYNPPDGGVTIDTECVERYTRLTATTVRVKLLSVELGITIIVYLLTRV